MRTMQCDREVTEDDVNRRWRDYSGLRVTLDGADAIICGWRCPFATVARRSGGQAVEFAWETVERVVAAGGAFRS